MERDLSFKKLIKMFILNIWIMILGGCICAVGLISVSSISENYTLVKKVYLVYDMEKPEEEDLTVRKNNYFDAYQNLYRSNFSWTSDKFSEEEKERVSNVSVEVSSCMYTITVTLPDGDNLEEDKTIFDELIQESEIWMKEKFHDDSLSVEVLSDETSVSQNGTSTIVKGALGFIVGTVLVAILLFTIFVLDKKIRKSDDIKYYLGLDCLSVVSEKKGIDDIREYVMLSDGTIVGITGVEKHSSKTKIAQMLYDKLSAVGQKVLYLSIEPNEEPKLHSGALNLQDALGKGDNTAQVIYIKDWSQVEKLVYSCEFEKMLDSYRTQYDCVIVNIVSMDENSIAKKVCSMCDSNILVFAKDDVNGETASESVSQLAKLEVKLAGAVLSKIDAKRRIIRF